MQVNQIATLMNTVTNEILGDSAIVNEDLTNVVDVGVAIFNSNAVDNYVKSLINHIGRVVFVDRPYSGIVPSVLMDSWEYGSVLEKIRMKLPQATANESWDLVDGKSYDPNIFYKPSISAKFFNSKVTFEIPMSFTQMQVKESFSNAEQLNGFLSMIRNSIERSMTIKLDSLVMRTINNFIANTLKTAFPTGNYGSGSKVNAVNILYLYNQKFGTNLTVAQAWSTPEFLRFASYIIMLYIDRFTVPSTLFNMGSDDRYTPRNLLHLVALNDFVQASNVYLQSDVYHNELTRLPAFESVPYWQGSGLNYDFTDISSIDVTTNTSDVVKASGVLAVMFDRDALGVTNFDRRVTSNWNPKAEFYNNWYKFDAGYFNDFDENFVVFYMAEPETEPEED